MIGKRETFENNILAIGCYGHQNASFHIIANDCGFAEILLLATARTGTFQNQRVAQRIV